MKNLPPALLLGLICTAVSAIGAPISYAINFSGGIPNPTAGSFTYDSVPSVFTAFIVDWQGITFDLTPAANNAIPFGPCDTAGNRAADAFAYLSDPTCGSGVRGIEWVASRGPSGISFSFLHETGVGRVSIIGFQAFTPVIGGEFTTSGTFSIIPTPEPSSIALMLSGALLAKRWSRSTASDRRRQAKD